MECYTAIKKKKKLLLHTITWINLRDLTLSKRNQWDLIKLKSFRTAKKTIKKKKKTTTEQEKIFANDLTDKDLISSIYKQLIQPQQQQQKPLKNGQKT